MHMMFATPCEEYKVNDVLVRALDRILILHADHEQNASTSTVRLAGSSGANPFACIAAGIACLWGPAHGGANEAAPEHARGESMAASRRSASSSTKVKDKNSGVKLMGFGHRVYKNFDPRAKLMRETCHEVLDELGLQDDPLFKLAMALEKIALEDDYFVSRKLYPNVDFYSGIVQSALGIPVSLFTGIFAMARTVGWIAQWNEMIADPEQKIGRPRQLFVGATRRDKPGSRAGATPLQSPGRHALTGPVRTDPPRSLGRRSGHLPKIGNGGPPEPLQPDGGVSRPCACDRSIFDEKLVREVKHHDEIVSRELVPVRRQRALYRGAVRELPEQPGLGRRDWRAYSDTCRRSRPPTAVRTPATSRTRRSSVVRRTAPRNGISSRS